MPRNETTKKASKQRAAVKKRLSTSKSKALKKFREGEWAFDPHGFITDGTCYFHVRKIEGVFLSANNAVCIELANTSYVISFDDIGSSRLLLSWFMMVMGMSGIIENDRLAMDYSTPHKIMSGS